VILATSIDDASNGESVSLLLVININNVSDSNGLQDMAIWAPKSPKSPFP